MSGIVYLLVLISVCAMSGAQLLLKKGLQIVPFPSGLSELGSFFVKAFSNGYILAAISLVVVTALCWMLAVSKAEHLSQLYPFMAISYILVALFSWWLFGESVSILRWMGIALICAGVVLVARS
jgi:uncharacterized membrane protein